MRHSSLAVTELPIWSAMELVWGKAGRLLGSSMRITCWAGRDHFGTYTESFKCCIQRKELQFITFQINTQNHLDGITYIFSSSFRFSVSNDLKYDAERDLRDIGAKNIQVHSLNKVRCVHDTRMQTRRVHWLLCQCVTQIHFYIFSLNMEKSLQNTMGAWRKVWYSPPTLRW